jgi:hypothetical protein
MNCHPVRRKVKRALVKGYAELIKLQEFLEA